MNEQPNPVDAQVGRNLLSIRIQRGISQEKLGEGCGITFQQIQKYEKGINRISASRLVEFTSLLNCQITDLFAGVVPTAQQIENRTMEQMKQERKMVEGYVQLPTDLQRQLSDLARAIALSLAAKMSVKDTEREIKDENRC